MKGVQIADIKADLFRQGMEIEDINSSINQLINEGWLFQDQLGGLYAAIDGKPILC